MSCQFEKNEEKRSPPVIMGTIYWLAPEILSMNFFGFKCDIWSLGIVGHEMVSGMPPFLDHEEDQNCRWPLLALVSHGPPPLENAEKYSSGLRSFLEGCLTEDYDARPSAEELLEHEFCTEMCNLVEFREFVEKTMRITYFALYCSMLKY